jgi:hypothetical protein
LLEVEGEKWLILAEDGARTHYNVYDAVPPGLATYAEPIASELPEPIAHLVENLDRSGYDVVMPDDRLQQTALLALALTFLIDRRRPVTAA